MDEAIEQLINKMHEKFGYCGHCGKHECAGKKQHSKLPSSINTTEMLKIINGLKKTEEQLTH